EVEPELAEDGRQDASDLIRFLDAIPPDIKATYLPGPAAIPRLMRFGMAVVSLGVVVSLIVLVALLMTPAA
ncbi:MAG: hypothetical protein JW910_01115, partial [Anaerolineae bacterium]|nr:hypothetical protein [Anaerolineae bacterium]